MNYCEKLNSEQCFYSKIDAKITDFLLTPLSCAALINEIIKSLLYQKSQIPYPYAWMKSIVNKKRNSTESKDTQNFTLNKHFKTVSSAYDGLESIMKEILKEFREYNHTIKDIVLVFGATPVCPKEVFTIRVSSLAKNHIEQNHSLDNRKLQKTLRDIFLSETWMGCLDNSIPCTNTYIYLKKYGCEESNSDIFLPCKPLTISSKIKHVIINLNYSNTNIYSCCHNLIVYGDSCDNKQMRSSENDKIVEKNNDDDIFWLQSKVLVQGFKDCFINKVSACELW